MEVCEGHSLSIADGVVTLAGAGAPSFFERAEEVEEFKVRLRSPLVRLALWRSPGSTSACLSKTC